MRSPSAFRPMWLLVLLPVATILGACVQVRETAEDTRTEVERSASEARLKEQMKEAEIDELSDPYSIEVAEALGLRYYTEESDEDGWEVKDIETNETVSLSNKALKGLSKEDAEASAEQLRQNAENDDDDDELPTPDLVGMPSPGHAPATPQH